MVFVGKVGRGDFVNRLSDNVFSFEPEKRFISRIAAEENSVDILVENRARDGIDESLQEARIILQPGFGFLLPRNVPQGFDGSDDIVVLIEER